MCKKRRKGAGPGWCPGTHLWPEIGAPGILGAGWGDRELAKASANEWGVRGGSRLGGRNVHPASRSHPVACCLDGSVLSPDCCVQPCPEARSGVTGGGAFKPTAWPGPAAAVFLGPCLEFGGPRGWRDGIEGLCAARAVSRPGEGSLATTGLHGPFSSRPGGRGEHPGPARPWPVLGLLVQSRSGPILASRGSVRIQTPLSPLRSHMSPPPSIPTACPPSCCLRVASAVTSCVFLRCPVAVPGLTACCVCPQERDGMRAILGSYDSELTPAEYSPQLTRRMREAEDMVQKVHAHSSEMEVSVWAGPAPRAPRPDWRPGVGGRQGAVAVLSRADLQWCFEWLFLPHPASRRKYQRVDSHLLTAHLVPCETLLRRDLRGRLSDPFGPPWRVLRESSLLSVCRVHPPHLSARPAVLAPPGPCLG